MLVVVLFDWTMRPLYVRHVGCFCKSTPTVSLLNRRDSQEISYKMTTAETLSFIKKYVSNLIVIINKAL